MNHESDTTKMTRIDNKEDEEPTNSNENTKTITLVVDGEEEQYEFLAETPQKDIMAFVESRMGIESDPPTEVDHPDLAFADVPADEVPQLEGFRTLCKLDGCHETEVFDSMDAIKDSDWTELEFGIGILEEMTDLNYGFCPAHSLTEEEGYRPEEDPGSHEYPSIDGEINR